MASNIHALMEDTGDKNPRRSDHVKDYMPAVFITENPFFDFVSRTALMRIFCQSLQAMIQVQKIFIGLAFAKSLNRILINFR